LVRPHDQDIAIRKTSCYKIGQTILPNLLLYAGWVTAKKEVAVLLIQRDSMPTGDINH
jgi:hypothetical protein